MSEVLRIGHKGAGLIEDGNSPAAFHAALSHGVDMIEFDVLPDFHDGRGELYLAHDYVDLARRPDALTLEEGLALFASEAFAGVRLDVDLKLPGYERRVVGALRRHGLVDRVLISTMEARSLRTIRALDPHIRLGWSVPKLRSNPMQHPVLKVGALALLPYARERIAHRMARALQAGEIDAVMAHFALVSRRFARTVLDAGGELYVWTVDDAERIEVLRQLEVTGIITNDPRLFSGT